MKRSPTRDRYDVAVIGGGVGGLVTGAFLAKAGRSVVVLEADDRPGGFARSFTSGGCSFDRAGHAIMGGVSGAHPGSNLIRQILTSLDVARDVELVPLDPLYAVFYRGERFIIPGGREPHLAALAEYFPAEAGGFRELFDLYDRIYLETTQMPVEASLRDLARMPWRYPLTFRKRHSTVADMIEKRLADPMARTVHTALWPHLGLPPSRASAMAWGVLMAGYSDSALYPVGGFQHFADVLAEGLRHEGGELACGERVVEIIASGGAVRGVTMASGRTIDAGVVITSIDPREALGPMLRGESTPQRYRRRLERSEASECVYALYLSCNIDLPAGQLAQETAVMTTSAEEAYWRARAGGVHQVMVTTPTLTDRRRSSTGCHTVVIKALCPTDQTRRDKGAFARDMIGLASQAIPGLADGIQRVHGATEDDPLPLFRLGPTHGWAQTPPQMALYRLGHLTPIDGLYLAGHWSQPAAGLWGAAASAVQLVRALLERDTGAGLLPIRL